MFGDILGIHSLNFKGVPSKELTKNLPTIAWEPFGEKTSL